MKEKLVQNVKFNRKLSCKDYITLSDEKAFIACKSLLKHTGNDVGSNILDY